MRRTLRVVVWTVVASMSFLGLAPIGSYYGIRAYGESKAREAGLTPDIIRTVVTSAHFRQVPRSNGSERCFAPIHVRVDEVSDIAKRVILYQEDRRFYDHGGSDPRRIVGAMLAWRPGRGLQGGSTITQQLVKNTVFLDGDGPWGRKVLEFGYARAFEGAAKKDEILAAYLNQIPFLHGIVGIEAFARYHFGKTAAEMNLYEAVLFARAVNKPGRYDPASHPEAAQAEAIRVLTRMKEDKFITPAQFRTAMRVKSTTGSMKDDLFELACGFFQQAAGKIDAEAGAKLKQLGVPGGYRSYVTINPRYQIEALAAAEAYTPRLERFGGSQLGLISLSRDGRLQATVGSADIEVSAWNRAVYANRQIGSLGKVIVLAAACEAGKTARSQVLDAPWSEGWPRNSDNLSHGRVSVSDLVTWSYNQAAVQLESKLGVNAVVGMAERFGFREVPRTLGVSLGIFEATPLQVARMMAVIDNGGRDVKPWAVSVVIGSKGQVLYAHQDDPKPEQIISPRCARMVRAVLKRVVSEGTAKTADFDVPAYGKTGTTSNYVDAWFAGHASSTNAAVWVGNDDPHVAMQSVRGGGIPALIMSTYFSNIVAVDRQRQRKRRPNVVADQRLKLGAL